MNLFERLKRARDFFIKKVVNSLSPKKVIVSSPGTGKTYLFRKVLEEKSGKCLALTFINNLADKLEEDLHDKAKCCTFHRFCTGLLHSIRCEGIDNKFTLYPKLDSIIKSDVQLLVGQYFNFTHCFRKLERTKQETLFFIKHSNYYNAVSFDDAVYRVLDHLEKNPKDIPKYEQIVVDEYQDFNKLEVAFIDILAAKSPILIVGDDDQALYGQLKDASARFIREKVKDEQYEYFELPYCSRCTRVIVEAINDVITVAKRINKLLNRVNRRYICFLPEKILDSRKYPKIIHAHCSVQSKKVPYMARYIEQEIDKLAQDDIRDANEHGDYTVLIAGHPYYLDQINCYLKRRKEWLIFSEYKKRKPASEKVTILEGYKILLNKDHFSNLGWRILLECEHIENLKAVFKKAINNERRLYGCLPKTFIKKHEQVLKILESVKTNAVLDKYDKKVLKSMFKEEIDYLRTYLAKDDEKEDATKKDKDINSLSIILTTYVGCKGLSAGYVFATGLNEGNLPRNNRNPTDIEICQFIVILARTIKKCYLLSVGRFGGSFAGYPSAFINWIDEKHIRDERVDKSYWETKKHF